MQIELDHHAYDELSQPPVVVRTITIRARSTNEQHWLAELARALLRVDLDATRPLPLQPLEIRVKDDPPRKP